jgi:hypothetical protein
VALTQERARRRARGEAGRTRMAEDGHGHEPGKMDITEQEKTFGLFLKIMMVTAVIVAAILIFLALVNA